MTFNAELRRKVLKLLEMDSEESRLAGLLYIEDGEVNPEVPGVIYFEFRTALWDGRDTAGGCA